MWQFVSRAFFLLGCASTAMGFVGVDRGEILLPLQPGKAASGVVTVTNSSAVRTTVSLSVDDFAIENGRPAFNSNSHPRALGKRLTVFPTSVDLEPGASQQVRVILDPGPGPFTAGTYWAVVFVQTSRLQEMLAPGTERQVQVRTIERVGVFVFADAEPERKPLPSDVEITGLAVATDKLVLTIRNPAKYLRIVTDGAVLVTPHRGGAAQKWPISTFRLLPESMLSVDVPIPAAAAGLGRASVLVTVDYGAPDLVAGEQEFTF
jgi:P pilus assembly chaperone PapD